MSTSEVDEDWIAEQMAHFTPADMHEAVRIMRGWVRTDRDRNRRTEVGEVA